MDLLSECLPKGSVESVQAATLEAPGRSRRDEARRGPPLPRALHGLRALQRALAALHVRDELHRFQGIWADKKANLGVRPLTAVSKPILAIKKALVSACRALHYITV